MKYPEPHQIEEMKEEEATWDQEREQAIKKYRNSGLFNVKLHFEVRGHHTEIKQLIQEFFEELESKLGSLEVVYEYYKKRG